MRVGIAGFGSIGSLHARIFDSLAEVAEVQVADSGRSRDDQYQSLAKKTAFHSDYEDLKGCDCVVIALPTELHEAAVSCFAGAGIPMLIEKPLGFTCDESQRIVDMIRRENVPAMCGLTGLYHPEFRAMYGQLSSLGELVSVHERLHEANPDLARLLGGRRGVVALNGIHTLHRFHRIALLKDPNKALQVADVALSHDNFMTRAEDHAAGTLCLGGTPFTFSMSFRNDSECDNGWPVDYGIEIVGTLGKIVVTGHEKCETFGHDGTTEVNYQHPGGPLMGQPRYERIALGLTVEIREFVQFLATGQKQHYTLEEALAGQRLVEDCYRKSVDQ